MRHKEWTTLLAGLLGGGNQRRNQRAVMRGINKGPPMNLLSHRNCDVFHDATALWPFWLKA
jgi:hypothetical protein